MRAELDFKIGKLQSHVFNWKNTDFDQFVLEFPIFKSLTVPETNMIK